MKFAPFGNLALAAEGALLGCGGRDPRVEAAPTVTKDVPRELPIAYRRTGGIVGLDDRIVIWPDGLAQLTDRSAGSLAVRVARHDRDEIVKAFAQCPDVREARPAIVVDACHHTIQQGDRIIAGNDVTMSGRMRDLVQKIEQSVRAATRASDQRAE